jgi:DNA-binding transcriptional ArsR family regulator
MKDGPIIASVAALIGDPARANMLTALMDGRALTASELAEAGGVALPTASGHLTKMASANLLSVEKQGRHRYFRLSGPDVGGVLETLMALAQRTGATRVRTGPADEALRDARICYDHLAGASGVSLMQSLVRNGLIEDAEVPAISDKGRTVLTAFGIDVKGVERQRRPACRHCLDWSERRHHLGGGLGAAILGLAMQRDWIRRAPGRTLRFTSIGTQGFKQTFGADSVG